MTVAAEVLPAGNKEQATEIRLWEPPQKRRSPKRGKANRSEAIRYGRCSGAVLSTLLALAVFGPRERSTKSAKMLSASSRSGSIAGVLVSSSRASATD